MTDHHDADEHLQKKRILGLTILIVVVALIGTAFAIWPGYYQNYAPTQPIPFSHQRHAGQFQIPCLYCHGSAEHAQFAAVPGTETCMNCHTQVLVDSPLIKQVKKAHDEKKPIAWVKVHVLPDFVYFNHSKHIAAGVECQTCHGEVQKMDTVYQFAPMTMGWCVSCHRSDNYVSTDRKLFSEATSAMRGNKEQSKISQILSHPPVQNADVSCSTCHR